MKRIILSILIFPVLCVIFINEITKTTIVKSNYKKYYIETINSNLKNVQQCSWVCHNNTNYCKENHVKLLVKYYKTTDPLYFGIVKPLKYTGNYRLANIILLVIIIPLILYALLLKSIQIQYKINNHKRIRND